MQSNCRHFGAPRAWCSLAGSAFALVVLTSCTASTTTATSSTTVPVVTTTVKPVTTTKPTTTTTTAAPTTTTTTKPYVAPAWIVEENAKLGTSNWQVTNPGENGDFIEGYFGSSQYASGETFALHVDTPAPTWHVEAYRMGNYGGKRGRLIWQSADQPGVKHGKPVIDPETNMAEARWPVSLTGAIDDSWPPGAYLFKLVSVDGAQGYVPITIHQPDHKADIAIVQAVVTWQTYNDWGSCSGYKCIAGRSRNENSRADVVSFDRPIWSYYNHGSADFLTHELPLIAFVEELGLNVTYITDVDLHQHPEWVTNYKSILTTGHDEYYTTAMYDALVAARDGGVNLAFFGANAVYRRVRLEPGEDGAKDRRVATYRLGHDPRGGGKNSTVEWRLIGRPENELIGISYGCAPMSGAMVVTHIDHWVWAGTGLAEGEVLPHMIGPEYDKIANNGLTPKSLVTLSESPVSCEGRRDTANSSYYVDKSGAGVFATGTIWWIQNLDAEVSGLRVSTVARIATENVLRRFIKGPSGP